MELVSSKADRLVSGVETLVPPLEITASHTEHVPILLVVLSSIKYCPKAYMLLSLSDSRGSTFSLPL